jgi:hypothetical protein
MPVVYLQQHSQVAFVMEKTRVAPIKTLTMPQLELMAALRLLHMMNVRFSLLNMAQRILGVTLPNF